MNLFALTYLAIFNWLWLGMFILFGLIEISALWLHKKFTEAGRYNDGTLSDFVRRIVRRNVYIFAVFTLVWIWLSYHFLVQ